MNGPLRLLIVCYGAGALLGALTLIEKITRWIVRRWLFPETLAPSKRRANRL
jgi:hypothetical protein